MTTIKLFISKDDNESVTFECNNITCKPNHIIHFNEVKIEPQVAMFLKHLNVMQETVKKGDYYPCHDTKWETI